MSTGVELLPGCFSVTAQGAEACEHCHPPRHRAHGEVTDPRIRIPGMGNHF